RDAITEGEWTHAPGRRLAQSHATTVPPSNGTRCRPAVSQKAPHVYLGSYNTTFREQIYIRWCCIDLLRPPRLSGLSPSFANTQHFFHSREGTCRARSFGLHSGGKGPRGCES